MTMTEDDRSGTFKGSRACLTVRYEIENRLRAVYRRRQFMVTLVDRPLTEETIADARAAQIFMG